MWIRKLERYKWVWISAATILLFMYLLPLFTTGQDLYIPPFDILDSVIVWYKILVESGKVFADSMEIIPNMMGGMPRISYGSELSLTLWLFYIFPPFSAFVANEILLHTVAFISMYVLLSHYFLPKIFVGRATTIVVSSLFFALLPYWSMGGLSVPSIPLALYVFLNFLTKKDSMTDWIILILIPFVSSLVLVYFFFLFTMGVVWLVDALQKGKPNLNFFAALLVMSILYLCVEYRLVTEMLLPSDFVSHRVEMSRIYVDLFGLYKGVHLTFLNGQEHTPVETSRYILPFIFFSLILTFFRQRLSASASLTTVILFLLMFFLDGWSSFFGHRYAMPVIFIFLLSGFIFHRRERILFQLMILQITFSFLYGVIYYRGLHALTKNFPFLEMFNLSRFSYLQPVLWYIIFAIALYSVSRKLKYGSLVAIVLALFQLPILFQDRSFSMPDEDRLTYKSYYATELFDDIRSYIGKPQNSYRVASFGIQPAVSQYNGFYTLDGYLANYQLEYQHLFSAFNNIDVERSRLNPFGGHWTSKCYFKTDGKTYFEYKRGEKINSLDLQFDLLRKHGLEYILSGYEILDPERYHLQFRNHFTSSTSYWDVYLYELDQ